MVRHQPVVAGQRAPDLAHPHPQGSLGVRGRLVAPQGVDQQASGRRLAGVQQQHCQRAALRWPREHQRRAVVSFGQ